MCQIFLVKLILKDNLSLLGAGVFDEFFLERLNWLIASYNNFSFRGLKLKLRF